VPTDNYVVGLRPAAFCCTRYSGQRSDQENQKLTSRRLLGRTVADQKKALLSGVNRSGGNIPRDCCKYILLLISSGNLSRSDLEWLYRPSASNQVQETSGKIRTTKLRESNHPSLRQDLPRIPKPSKKDGNKRTSAPRADSTFLNRPHSRENDIAKLGFLGSAASKDFFPHRHGVVELAVYQEIETPVLNWSS